MIIMVFIAALNGDNVTSGNEKRQPISHTLYCILGLHSSAVAPPPMKANGIVGRHWSSKFDTVIYSYVSQKYNIDTSLGQLQPFFLLNLQFPLHMYGPHFCDY
jgi:hypothetical protein